MRAWLAAGAAVLIGLAVAVVIGRYWLSAPTHRAGFIVGFDDDLAERDGAAATTRMRQLGATALRVTLQWAPGEAALSQADAEALGRAVSASAGLRVLLTVYGQDARAAPLTPADRHGYCAYVSSALVRYPAVRDVVIWNEPNKHQFWSPQAGAPGAYESLLAECYDALHTALPGVNVLGLALAHDGHDDEAGTSPGGFIRDVGAAYRASGRVGRIMDTVAFHPYGTSAGESPYLRHVGTSVIGEGDWNKLMYNLSLAFSGTGQPLPGEGGVSIWYSEWGVQSAIPAAKAGAYTGDETVPVVDEATQAAQVHAAVDLAACQPYVHAFFNFLLEDEARLAGWQSGALYADGTAKTSAAGFGRTFHRAAGRRVDCAQLPGGSPSADFLPPTAPSGLQVSAGGGVASLRWTAATDDGSAISYRVYRGTSLVATTTSTAWTGPAAGRAASYSVRAIDAAGNLGPPSVP